MAISVVIPTLNEAKYIPACIESLAKQTLPPTEIISIDKSTDSTPQLCQSAGWKVITQIPPGIGAARSQGWAAASGDIIASTDADTIVNPKWLETAAQVLKDPRIVAVYGPVYLSGKNPFSYQIMTVLGNFFFQLLHFLRKDHLVGMNFVAKKSAYTAAGGFNPRLFTAEDADLGYRLAKVGKIAYSKTMYVHTSNRRLKAYTLPGFIAHHFKNYFSLLLSGKASARFEPIR